jgi:TonB-linked SusC/RagA family outer membrane protein
VGWQVAEESFMSSIDAIDALKLRAGYGKTGNESIPAGKAFDTYGGGTGSTFYDISGGNTLATGYALTAYGNESLGWETNITFNAGFDLTLNGGKFTVVADYFTRGVEDLLYAPSIPATAGSAEPPMKNLASMENKGFELSLGWKGNLSSDLKMNLDLNVTHYKNEITYISDELEFFNSNGADGFTDYVRNYVGHPMASFYGYRYLGPLRTDDEAANAPTSTLGPNFAGGWKFADLDGDGDIDPNDREIIGNPHPDVILGLNIALTYGNFDFSMFLYSSIGNDIFNYQRYYYETGRWGSGFSKDMLTDAWTPENPGARLPALSAANNGSAGVSSSYYIEDGSFLRARTINLGYNLPSTALSKLGMSNCRVYVQAQNLFTITKYSGIDPELSNYSIGDGGANSQFMGVDLGSYPSSKIFSAGVSLGF